MSGISTGVGLISGIDTASLIDQLISIESRPIRDLQTRVGTIDAQRTALLALSAQLLALQNSVAQFDKPSFFDQFTSESSNDRIATATASESAVPGSYRFRVNSLVANHSVVSRGFADADKTPVGVGTLTVEVGRGKVNTSTPLNALRGGEGVRRGVITITDRTGASADIDLSQALTISDILQAINTASAINVRASATGVASHGATGDRMVIEDLNVFPDPNQGPVNLVIADKNGGATAADLGLVADVAASRVDGTDLIRLAGGTLLSTLNDGNGVGRLPQGGGSDLIFDTTQGRFEVSLSGVLALQLDTDLRALNGGNGVRLGTIRITDRAGKSVDIDLADPAQPPVQSFRDLRERITSAATAAGVSISVGGANSDLSIIDNTNLTGVNASNLIVEDLVGYSAEDLGIVGDVAANQITGRDIFRIQTIGDVINAINFAPDNHHFVEARISDDGNGITLRALGLDNSVTVSAAAGSSAAENLGIADVTFSSSDAVPSFSSRALIAGFNTVLLHSLQGGLGVGVGSVSLTDRSNQTAVIDLSSARTLQDVVDLINADAGTSLVASINRVGHGLALRDESGGSGSIDIRDVAGSLAADLGLAGTYDVSAGDTIDGGNAQVQYISRNTPVTDYNFGRGIEPGGFLVTDSSGASHKVDLASNLTTLGEVIDSINIQAGGAFSARINDQGDGLLVEDQAGGSGSLTIAEVDGGQSAADLHLAGTAKRGQTFIDGSLEIRIDIGANDTLNDIAGKLNQSGAEVSASTVNDGSGINAFSLTLSSSVTGLAGQMVVDSQGFELGFDTLAQAQDAVLSVGGSNAAQSILISSSSNTIEDVIPGVSVNLLSAGDEDITVTVAQDVKGIVDQVQSFVDQFNTVQGTIDDDTSFDQDTLARGPLLGDPTVNRVRSRLQRVITHPFTGASSSLSRLFLVGLSFGANNRLQFDEEKFQEQVVESPQSLKELFSSEDGFGKMIQETLDELTRDADGLIARRDSLLNDQKTILNDRIDQLQVLVDAKRARLQSQFAGLETALSGLQGQQTSLSALAQLAGNTGGS